ncbi:MAG: CPXCG motif-containing cysteine-rich protein [Bdellovibrionota bacterium]|nr:CPXCG motif-containing cysteine-rich protein [Bdellovibrionota bacterium]
MEGETEYFFQCPFCFSRISMVIEVYYGGQKYIEDCEVCCRPIEISYSVEENKVVGFQAERACE